MRLSLRPLPLALTLPLLLAACGPGAVVAPQPPPRAGGLDLAAYRALVEQLASDELQGRGLLTKGNLLATELLEKAFREAGLEPAGDDGTFRQCFEVPVTVEAEREVLTVDGRAIDAAAMEPARLSASGGFAGELVFAGYGIHAPKAGYDDFAKLDASGKVLLMLRFEPRERDKESPLNGDRPARESELRRKVFEARSRGARAVIFVAPPDARGQLDRSLPPLGAGAPESDAGLPVLHVLPSVADGWLQAKGTSVEALAEAIDKDFASRPLPLGRVEGEVGVKRKGQQLCNVLGRRPGRGPLADEAIVIGAHFDHLGFGQQGSMAPDVEAIHNGADDNASGAAALVALARMLRSSDDRWAHRTLIFAAFNAEEVGLRGSSAYVKRPPHPLAKTQAMLNMDMIGRLRDKLVVLGTDTGEGWGALVDEVAAQVGVTVSKHGDGYGPSDQMPFYQHGVPVLHFFSGAHDDYHRPSDDAHKLNWKGAAKVIEVVAAVAHRAAYQGPRIAYKESQAGPPLAGDSRSFGAYLGTIPDYTAMSPGAEEGPKGVLLAGVREGGPAAKAGMLKGDRIVAMGDRAVENLYDFSFILRDHRPGKVIEVVVLRDGKRVKLAATLASRPAGGRHGGGGHGHGDKGGHGHGDKGGHGHGDKGRHGHGGPAAGPPMDPETLLYPGEERFLANVKQLTFEGENAEAYFSPDGKRLTFQARGKDVPCDRIYTYDLASGAIAQISSGKGRTTCAYYTFPKGDGIVYASTHLGGDACPPAPDHSKGYVWPLYDSYDLFLKPAKGKLKRLTSTPGYDAEATVCFRDGRIVFTSTRDGDIDLYVMDPARPKAKPVRITTEPGYDGGAFFSPDCSKLVWRASRPTGEKLEAFRKLLAEGLVRPSQMEIFVGDADGKSAKQVTHNGAANFAPYFMPDNRRVLFSSNVGDPSKRNFDIYLIDPYAKDPDATLQRVTHSPVFEAFPMFSPDGKRLVFASNRNAKQRGDTNLFIADWVGP